MLQDWKPPPGTSIRSQPPKTGRRAGLSTSLTKIGVVSVLAKPIGGRVLTATVPVTGTAAFPIFAVTVPCTGSGVFTTVTGIAGVGGGAGTAGAGVLFNRLIANTR